MTLNRYRLRHLAEGGSKGAIKAARLLARPDRLIGLILLGNNFVNILASSIATLLALRFGGEAALAVATGLLTLVVLIFSEVTPKTLAALHPERFAFLAAHIYEPLLKICYPLVWVINIIANQLLALFGVGRDMESDLSLSREELRTVVNEAGAMIPQRHQQMLLSILDLEQATVEDIMIPRNEIIGVDIEDPWEEIKHQITNTPYTKLPVYRDNIDDVIGILPLRNLMLLLKQEDFNSEELLKSVQEAYFIPEGTPLNTQILNFQKKRQRLGLVVDEYGDILGLATLEDILEEIIGEFTTDPADLNRDIQPQEDGSYLVDGGTHVRDLNRSLDWDLPTDGPKTLNGIILEHMETIPQPGTTMLLADRPVEIVQILDNMVKIARILPNLYKMDTQNTVQADSENTE